MTHIRSLALITALTFLSACATTTPYQAASKPGGSDGYSQTMIENDRARVTFGGNSLTDKDTVENYLLYRAAELTKERGFDYFSLIERETEANTRVDVGSNFNRYDPFFNYAFYRPYHGWSRYHPYSRYFAGPHYSNFGPRINDGFFNDYSLNEVTKYRASAEVKFGRGNRPAADNAFDAEQVLANLGPTIIFPAESD